MFAVIHSVLNQYTTHNFIMSLGASYGLLSSTFWLTYWTSYYR